MKNILDLSFNEIQKRFKDLEKGKEINIEVFSFKKTGKDNNLFLFVGNTFNDIEVGDYFKSKEGHNFIILEILDFDKEEKLKVFSIICGLI